MISLIFGANGQTARYLNKFLDHEIHGVIREKNNIGADYAHIYTGDICNLEFCKDVIAQCAPDYIFNMAAQSSVNNSFFDPYQCIQTNTIGTLNILESIKSVSPHSRLLQASSSEMFGNSYSEHFNSWFEFSDRYQDETTPFKPCSPYGVSKLAAHNLIDVYRKSYNLFCCSAICFNHESPYRPENFVSRKISRWVAQLYHGKSSNKLKLGNIYTSRDWGHASDYARAMISILKHDKPDDYVICTGQTHTIEDFLKIAFNKIGISNYMDYIDIDSALFRPIDVNYSNGKYDKIYATLRWAPQISFREMVEEMIEYDIRDLQ